MKLLKIIFIFILFLTFSNGNSFNGHKIYLKKLRNNCGLSAYAFTSKYTQKEWKDFFRKGTFEEKILEICPKLKKDKLEEINLQDIFDFAYKYAKDSHNVPF